jgi:hypothetical protein
VVATAEQRNHARAFLKKSEEYLASAEVNLAAERYTPAAAEYRRHIENQIRAGNTTLP